SALGWPVWARSSLSEQKSSSREVVRVVRVNRAVDVVAKGAPVMRPGHRRAEASHPNNGSPAREEQQKTLRGVYPFLGTPGRRPPPRPRRIALTRVCRARPPEAGGPAKGVLRRLALNRGPGAC